jgi:hypothetical protein
MRTTLDRPAGFGAGSDQDERCHVAVLYEDTESRERAVTLSHHLVQRFWKEIDFSFSWWRFRYLSDPQLSEEAAEAASRCDVLVFAALADGSPASEVQEWFTLWDSRRSGQPGVLVPLLHPDDPETLSASSWMVELEELAGRTALDCLLPYRLLESPLFDPSSRRLQHRCRHVGGLLGDILRHPGHLPGTQGSWNPKD